MESQNGPLEGNALSENAVNASRHRGLVTVSSLLSANQRLTPCTEGPLTVSTSVNPK